MKANYLFSLASALFTAFTVSTQAQVTITQWNFNNITPGVISTATPTLGSGTLTLIGGVTHPATGSSGTGSSDTAATNLGLQTTTYPAQSTASGSAGVQFNVSTSGFSAPTYTGLEVRFDLRLSNTAGRWFRLDYTTNGGSTWNLGTPTRLGIPANVGDTWFNLNAVTISDLAALNNSAFGFRVVSVFSPVAFIEANSSTNYLPNAAYEVARNTISSYSGSGTWRFDMVTLSAIPEPSTWALIGLGTALVLWQIRRRSAA